jgi:hypothetical protein
VTYAAHDMCRMIAVLQPAAFLADCGGKGGPCCACCGRPRLQAARGLGALRLTCDMHSIGILDICRVKNGAMLRVLVPRALGACRLTCDTRSIQPCILKPSMLVWTRQVAQRHLLRDRGYLALVSSHVHMLLCSGWLRTSLTMAPWLQPSCAQLSKCELLPANC